MGFHDTKTAIYLVGMVLINTENAPASLVLCFASPLSVKESLIIELANEISGNACDLMTARF